jgi:hypothetical protein
MIDDIYDAPNLPTDPKPAPVESVRAIFTADIPAPAPDQIRGRCPQCGDRLVSNVYLQEAGC